MYNKIKEILAEELPHQLKYKEGSKEWSIHLDHILKRILTTMKDHISNQLK